MRFIPLVRGQEDVAWPEWLALAETCERLGFEGLFRSDHYRSVDDRADRGAMDAWGTICALAAVTSRIRLGTLVSPTTFRHPSVLAKLVVTADHISGGRVELGIGAGWLQREHEAYGFPFPSMRERMDGLEEQLEIITRSWGKGAFTFEGEFFTLRDHDAQPKPVQQPHPPILMGGAGGPRALRLAARYADEYNFVVGPENARDCRSRMEAACEAAGRDPETMTMSIMASLLLGADEADLHARAARLSERLGREVDLPELRRTQLVGTPEEVGEKLRGYEEAGVGRMMMLLQLHEDLEQLELFASVLAPAFGG
jgi:F420-dependent oxidoreductase-like protein